MALPCIKLSMELKDGNVRLVLHAQRKPVTVAQKVENLQHPECTAPYQTCEHSG